MDVLIADFSLFNHVLFMLILIITNDFLNFIEIMNWVFEIEVSIFGYENRECRVPVRGVLYYRCERTQTQQAQYNEFGRDAGLRTGPLQGLYQRSGRIVGEQDRQRHRGGVKVYPRASSEDEFLFSFSDTTQLRPSGVFRIALLFCEISLVIYSSTPLILAVHLLIVQVATWVSVPSSASLNLLWVVVGRVTLFRGHSFINAAKLPAAGI